MVLGQFSDICGISDNWPRTMRATIPQLCYNKIGLHITIERNVGIIVELITHTSHNHVSNKSLKKVVKFVQFNSIQSFI